MVNIDRISSALWAVAGLIALVKGAIRDDIMFMVVGILCFILSYVIKLCVLSEQGDGGSKC